MTCTVILRERGAQVALHPSSGLDHRKAEAEVSRLNFRDDGARYTAITGIFRNEGEARLYAQLRCKGASIAQAMKQITRARG